MHDCYLQDLDPATCDNKPLSQQVNQYRAAFCDSDFHLLFFATNVQNQRFVIFIELVLNTNALFFCLFKVFVYNCEQTDTKRAQNNFERLIWI